MLHSALDQRSFSPYLSYLGFGYDVPPTHRAATKHRFYHPNRIQISLVMIESVFYHFQLSFTSRKAQYLCGSRMGRLIRKCYKFTVFKNWLALVATDDRFDRTYQGTITSTDSG